MQRLFQNGNLYRCHNLILKFVHFIFDSNSINQGGNIERRDVGDSAGVNSKLSDVQTAIESLTHSVNHMSTQQLVSSYGVKSVDKTPASLAYASHG